ncbi:MAG TPA: hypothetical protein VLH19_03465 [Patescibacteria group bacterium]|nr:hypothetical protein [Patescibacteria group bacterium]
MFKKLSALFFAFVVFFSLGARFSYAQDTTTPITTQEAKYRGLLDDYRKAQDQFIVSAGQYYNLQTLAAQEDAVRALRSVMLTRDDVVIAYFDLLELEINTVPGIELSRKGQLTSQIDIQKDQLKSHRARVEITTDRINLNLEASGFSQLEAQLEATSDRSLSLLKIAGIQAALDQLVLTKSQLDSFVASAPISETVRGEKQRGLDEMGRSVESIKLVISKALTRYDESLRSISNPGFSEVRSILNPGFATLTQAVQFAREIIQ